MAAITLEAAHGWDRYVATVRAQMDAVCRVRAASLWSEEAGARFRKVLGGGMVVEATAGAGPTATTQGTIHDWTGAIYLPGITPAQVFTKLNETEVVQRSGNGVRFVAKSRDWNAPSGCILRASYQSLYSWPAPEGWWSLSSSIGEMRDLGGYIHRLSCATCVVAADGGSIVELRALVLACRVPKPIAWLANAFARRLCRTAIMMTLRQTRHALSMRSGRR